MAMTLQLDDAEVQALREVAEREDRSVHEVARQAIREYLELRKRGDGLERVFEEELPRYSQALRRLGE